ncbi:MAG: tRNA uridine-5-carboxymethylaminomethyl(34) synthesis GTPase MnmE [Helicobacter sp.]|uniref:tRNA uridine-5-carboxymethylaminomethyl(34) synthesis GTPase MnmE n=1 Tax=Helicobacter sp. TaxID=218 RepID=UPI0023C7397B|nr:tRNA uridine-5-carboxymethylaminomethyl(34) synthesis GTPase MnmE [Helicobacter sp.]MDE5925852.1 tRNA uridine-5-carboxymethylaminomethyl(34) synthesis GTPase MnmE [Helicobacter sp.]MDE7175543.1 tRNA uridine-5-carboxymethylaminomethyl(34) synthesis GTPase MnmE [Helicobacter sp.]
MLDEDTIIAPATTYGKSSLNVLRLSGKDSLNIAAKLAKTTPENLMASLPVRYAKLTKIYFDNNDLLDECILLYFKAPHSYTTQDVVEFQCHGGSFIAQNILQECLRYGARLANPGEFTKRAFLGGRIDLSQAQAVAKLIESQSAAAHKMLMRHLKGEMQDFCENLRTDLISLLAHSEVFIDYAEEELPKDLLQNLENKLHTTLKTLHNLLEQSTAKRALFEGYKLCIIGKPNVGKSSLLNALLHSNRAIVSEIAGTTRDSIEENFMLGGHLLRLIDTAGIHQTKNKIESEGIKRSLERASESDLLIALFDGSSAMTQEDLQVLELLKTYQSSKKIFVVVNKADLECKLDWTLLQSFNPIKLCLKGDLYSEDSLLSCFKKQLESLLDSKEESQSLLLTSEYQFQAVQTCINALKESFLPLQNGELEIFSFHLNEALKAIASITQPYEYSQMLDVMFGDFCLGK